MTRLNGYGRVLQSTSAAEEQKEALLAAGCSKVFGRLTSSIKGWPVLKDAMPYSRAGDTFVVERLDRMGRPISQIVSILFELDERGIEFRSLSDEFDIVSTPVSIAIKSLHELEKIMHRSRLARARCEFEQKERLREAREGATKEVERRMIALARALLEENVLGSRLLGC